MNSISAAVDQREKGAIPVSIGTSLALEAASGVYPERPVSPAPILQVKEVWFNLRTLFRNLVGCLPTEVKDLVTAGPLYAALLEELTIIESAVVKASEGRSRAIFYVCDYSGMARKFPKALLKRPKTEKQEMAKAIEDATLRAIWEDRPSVDLRSFRFELTGKYPNSFIVTHLPVDLLSRYNFQKLELLESHTGAIKPYPQWHTKLTGGKELGHIPFNAFSLQVFGDNGHHFSPLPMKLRKEVLRLAEEDRWTSLTTEEKIRVSLKKIEDPQDRTILLSML